MKIKTIQLLAILFALIACFTSCSQKTYRPDEENNSGSNAPATTAVDLFEDLPTGNFYGVEFTILNGQVTWSYDEMDCGELKGDIIGDAVYKRNRRVESDLNIKISVINVPDDQAMSKVRLAVGANDDIYDAVFAGAYRIAPANPQTLVYELKDIEGLNLSKPWWDQNTMNYYKINDKLFMAHGNLQVSYFEGLWSMMFNKQMCKDLNLKNPYELVKKGEWTFDEMLQMMSAASVDLNNNNIGDREDQFGLVTHIGSCLAFLHGFDERLIKLNEEKYPYLSHVDDRMYDRIELIKNTLLNTNISGMREIVAQGVPDFSNWVSTKFTQGGSLFMVEVMGRVSDLRDMDVDFGLLPFPKYDLNQSEYISYISPASSALCIPLSCENTKMSGVVLENMCAKSYDILMPAYYEKTLRGKNVRDSESVEMLDFMFGNIECELGYVYNWENLYTKYSNIIKGLSETTSTFESIRESVTSGINKTFASTN